MVFASYSFLLLLPYTFYSLFLYAITLPLFSLLSFFSFFLRAFSFLNNSLALNISLLIALSFLLSILLSLSSLLSCLLRNSFSLWADFFHACFFGLYFLAPPRCPLYSFVRGLGALTRLYNLALADEVALAWATTCANFWAFLKRLKDLWFPPALIKPGIQY